MASFSVSNCFVFLVFFSLSAWAQNSTSVKSNGKAKEEIAISLFSVIQSSQRLSTLAKIIEAAGLAEVLSDESLEYTIFAPNNYAFLEVFGEDLSLEVFTAIRQEILRDMLYYHVVPTGKYDEKALKDKLVLNTLIQGDDLEVVVNNNSSAIKGSSNRGNFLEFDLFGGEGVVHIIDAVLDHVPAISENEQTQQQVNATEIEESQNVVIEEEKVPILETDVEKETQVGEFSTPVMEVQMEVEIAQESAATIISSSPVTEVEEAVIIPVPFQVAAPISEKATVSDVTKTAKMTAPIVENEKEKEGSLAMPALTPVSANQTESVIESALDTIIAAIDVVGIELELSDEEGYTIFAPTTSAFNKMLEFYGAADIESLDEPTLKSILLQHIIVGSYLESELEVALNLDSMDGPFVRVLKPNNSIIISAIGSRANVLISDLPIGTSIVHIVDNVLLPFAPTEKISNDTCSDVSPDLRFDCSEQEDFGKCEELWMIEGNYCLDSCDRCGVLTESDGEVCELNLVEKLKGAVQKTLEEDASGSCRGSELEGILLSIVDEILTES